MLASAPVTPNRSAQSRQGRPPIRAAGGLDGERSPLTISMLAVLSGRRSAAGALRSNEVYLPRIRLDRASAPQINAVRYTFNKTTAKRW